MRKIAIILLIALLVSVIGGCGTKTPVEPDLSQIRSICELATLECYYHNVVKATKPKTEGFAGIGEVDREFWMEYDGIVKIGIDLSQVLLEVNANKVTVTLPEAKIVEVAIDKETWDASVYIHSEDSWFNKNKITADDQTKAFAQAQKEMEEEAAGNTYLLETARNRAQKLIENYIHRLGELSGIEYEIHWKYMENNIQN